MLPTCGLNDHVTAVFEVPLTVALKVALWPPSTDTLAGDRLILTVCGGGVATRVMEAAALLVVFAMLTAVTTTACCEGTLAGAVYNPLTMLPIFGVNDQRTPVFEVPSTAAVNWADCPPISAVEPGATEILTVWVGGGGVVDTGCPTVTVAVAVLVKSARLVAEIVTWASYHIEEGARYTPFTMVPSLGLIAHSTW
jgi:hypothetical protein